MAPFLIIKRVGSGQSVAMKVVNVDAIGNNQHTHRLWNRSELTTDFCKDFLMVFMAVISITIRAIIGNNFSSKRTRGVREIL